MSIYTAIRCDDSGEIPEVRLYTKLQDAVDWLLYPWRDEIEEHDPALIQRMEQDLLNFKTIDMAETADVGSTEQMVVLNLVPL